jgi:hypothetical protein
VHCVNPALPILYVVADALGGFGAVECEATASPGIGSQTIRVPSSRTTADRRLRCPYG